MSYEDQRNLKKLTGRHRIMLRLYCKGVSSTEIANHVGITQQRASTIITSERFQAAYREMTYRMDKMFAEDEVDEELHDPVRQRLKEERMNNLETIISIRDNAVAKPETRAKCAMDLLDRDGYKATEEHTVTSRVILSDDAARTLDAAAKDVLAKQIASDISSNLIISGDSNG